MPSGSLRELGDLLPGVAAVLGAIDTALGAAGLGAPGLALELPDGREEHVGIRRIHDEIDGAALGALEEDALPALAAILRTEDTLLLGAGPKA